MWHGARLALPAVADIPPIGTGFRRTALANERTWLAWVRTGLASTAVSIGVGRVVPAVSDVARWPYVVVGVGYAILGAGLVVYGFIRKRDVEAAVERGDYMPPHDIALLAFAVLATLLVVATGALVIVD